MPKITIEKTCNHKPSDAFSKLKALFADDPDLKKMDAGYKCQFQEQALTGTAQGSKFKADMAVKGSGESSTVSIVVDLPLMLSPFKGVIETTLKKKLDHHLG